MPPPKKDSTSALSFIDPSGPDDSPPRVIISSILKISITRLSTELFEEEIPAKLAVSNNKKIQ